MEVSTCAPPNHRPDPYGGAERRIQFFMGSPKKKTPRSSALIGLRIATFADAAIAQINS
jgi:hypothetical protein